MLLIWSGARNYMMHVDSKQELADLVDAGRAMLQNRIGKS